VRRFSDLGVRLARRHRLAVQALMREPLVTNGAPLSERAIDLPAHRCKGGRRMQKDLRQFANCRKVLDVGCGRGAFLRTVGARGVGVDGAAEHVSVCRAGGLDVQQVLLPGALPFEDGAFDGVYCSHVVEHLPPADAARLMAEIDRVLCPGGVLLVRSPLASKHFWDDPTHVRPYHLHCLLQFLGGWEAPGTRQMILGTERPRYRLCAYYEEIRRWYDSTVAVTIDPRRFPVRVALTAVFEVLARVGIGRRDAYGAVLRKDKA
jgi:SAM-dependent methyltransferase